MTPQPWTTVAARLSSLKQSERLRVVGILVLVLGIAGACLFYGIEARSAAPTMDELLPGYASAQAIIIATVSALVALGCFRAAWVLDDDEQVRVRAR